MVVPGLGITAPRRSPRSILLRRRRTWIPGAITIILVPVTVSAVVPIGGIGPAGLAIIPIGRTRVGGVVPMGVVARPLRLTPRTGTPSLGRTAAPTSIAVVIGLALLMVPPVFKEVVGVVDQLVDQAPHFGERSVIPISRMHTAPMAFVEKDVESLLDFLWVETTEIFKHGRIIEHGPVSMQVFVEGTECANRVKRAMIEVTMVDGVAEIASRRQPVVHSVLEDVFR